MARGFLPFLAVVLSSWSVTAAPATRGDDTFIGLPISNPDAQRVVPHSFIVVYNSTFATDKLDSAIASITSKIARRNLNKRSELTGRFFSTGVHNFQFDTWRASTLEADDKTIIEIFSQPEVAYIEQDTYLDINAQLTQGGSTVGLARMSHSELNQDNQNRYVFDSSAGEGITAYVVDTGIRITHNQFEGRAIWGENFVNDVVSGIV